MFTEFKVSLYIVLLCLYTVGVSYLSFMYKDKQYLGQQVSILQAVAKAHEQDSLLKESILHSMETTLSTLAPQNTTINRTIQNDIYKNTAYVDCKSDPSVMREYQHKLDIQPE